MTDSDEDALKADQGPSQDIPKPWVFPAPKGILQHIFGTSQVFQSICDVKPKVTGLTVPLKVREYYSRGQQCLEQADWETAVLFFSRALHLDPQLVDFYALRAEAYLQLCDFSSAAQNLRRAYSLQQDNCKHLERLTFALYLQGQCLFEQCAFLDALNVFSHAAELQPEKPCFRYRCMACLLALKRHQACLSLITKELKQDTTNADVYILRARLYNFLQTVQREGRAGACPANLGVLSVPQDCRKRQGCQPAQKPHPTVRWMLSSLGRGPQQFQKAEDHFSTAIRHNPQKAQYYLYRAKSRQLLQNIFGARQDVATVLLLNPKQPKLSLLMTNLFPGMSVEEVLSTQIAHLARLQLERMVKGSLQAGSLQASSPQGIVGMLKQQELERQKALALQHSWKQGEPLIATSEELKATPEILQVELGSSEGEAEAPEEEEEKEKEKKEEKKPELIPSKVMSLSDSYLDQTSSASSMSFRTTCTSETETSAICQEYRSTSATAVTFSDSSLLKTQSSDSGNNREALSHGPRKIKATQGQRQSLSKTEATQSQRRNSSKTKATQSQGQSSSKTKATQSQGQSSSKTKATQSPRQRPRKVKAACGRSWRPSKVDATQGQSRGLLRSSTKTEAFYDSNWSLSKTEDAQGQGQKPSKAEAAQGKSQAMSSTSSKAESTWGPSPSLSKTEVDQDLTYYEAV
ncbi:tetratricopeptide repeat protein 16 [Hylobates moloch]|uniref:tetratricopeptide repeat protein 16 n=1 Tax=Hylobates moloch TaxID=81572 RepID=UPI0013625085|nr:tetratricopeptide repeat protein 16 [Hylobates moloch]